MGCGVLIFVCVYVCVCVVLPGSEYYSKLKFFTGLLNTRWSTIHILYSYIGNLDFFYLSLISEALRRQALQISAV